MHSISILVALTMPSIIVDSLVSEVVVWPTKALENNIYCSSLQKYIIETAWMFLGSIALALVITMRVEKEKEAPRHRDSR